MIYRYPGIFEELFEDRCDFILPLRGRRARTKEINPPNFFGVINKVVVFIQQLKDKALVVQVRVNTHHPESRYNLSPLGQSPIRKPGAAKYNSDHIDSTSIMSNISLFSLNAFLFNTSSRGVVLISLPRNPTITRVSPASRCRTAA